MDEVQVVSNEEQMKKSYRLGLQRFFSMDSEINLNYESPYFPNNVCGKQLLVKILQLILGCICAGLYSEGIKVMTFSLTSMTFPYVVYGSFIIITSIIILSYMLGYAMPDVLVRIFNTLATILYFVAATVTMYVWFSRHSDSDSDHKVPYLFLLIVAVISYLNALVHGLDAFFSYKKAMLFYELN